MKYFLALAPLCALLLSTACTQSPEKLISAGNRYHDKKKYSEASILYQKAISKDKTNGEAYYREGLNLLDSHDPVGAARFLRRAVDLQPGNSDAETKLADIYLAAYATNPRRFKALLPDIRDLDNKILQHQPNSFNGLRLEGLLYLAENQRDKALDYLGKANQAKPHSPDLVWWYGEALATSGRVPEAEALVRDMLNSDPKWGRGYDFLFILYTREKDQQKAEAVLREHVEKDPANIAALDNLATYLLATNRFPEAESLITRVLRDPKAFPQGHETVGDFYFRAKKY
ncbi:MAG: tetratricopeptide repeat protein, partial [Acidobacteriaceae bacterium]|nr:tetratricopeptide repeat protein [Acidobacteriaceae bacterium]